MSKAVPRKSDARLSETGQTRLNEVDQTRLNKVGQTHLNETGQTRLKDIMPGERAYVCEIKSQGDMRRRFQDIGLIEGTIVECLGRSPAGDPSAFLIRGAVIAIRSDDSKDIIVSSMVP